MRSFLVVDHPDDRGLNDGHQRHVAVCRHHDRTQILGTQGVGHKNSGGAVRCADDGDGGCILQIKNEACQEEGEEDAELCRSAEQHQPRFFQQGAKVDHRADADEQQQREQLVCHARLKQRRDGAFCLALGDSARHRQVDQDRTKAHGQQQAGLHLFNDGQVDQQCADRPHDHHLPGQVPKVGEQAGEGLEKIHSVLTYLLTFHSK